MNDTEKEKAFVEMIEANQHLIYKVCYMYSHDKENIDDLYQDVVLNLWKSYSNFRNESKRSTWIYRVTLNTCITYYRRFLRQPKVVPITLDIVNNQDDDSYVQGLIGELYNMIGLLNETEKAIILLYLDKNSYREIADIMGLSVSNVGIRLLRIKDKLKTSKIK